MVGYISANYGWDREDMPPNISLGDIFVGKSPIFNLLSLLYHKVGVCRIDLTFSSVSLKRTAESVQFLIKNMIWF